MPKKFHSYRKFLCTTEECTTSLVDDFASFLVAFGVLLLVLDGRPLKIMNLFRQNVYVPFLLWCNKFIIVIAVLRFCSIMLTFIRILAIIWLTRRRGWRGALKV